MTMIRGKQRTFKTSNSMQFIYKEPNHKTGHVKALYKQVHVMNSNKPSYNTVQFTEPVSCLRKQLIVLKAHLNTVLSLLSWGLRRQ